MPYINMLTILMSTYICIQRLNSPTNDYFVLFICNNVFHEISIFFFPSWWREEKWHCYGYPDNGINNNRRSVMMSLVCSTYCLVWFYLLKIKYKKNKLIQKVLRKRDKKGRSNNHVFTIWDSSLSSILDIEISTNMTWNHQFLILRFLRIWHEIINSWYWDFYEYGM